MSYRQVCIIALLPGALKRCSIVCCVAFAITVLQVLVCCENHTALFIFNNIFNSNCSFFQLAAGIFRRHPRERWRSRRIHGKSSGNILSAFRQIKQSIPTLAVQGSLQLNVIAAIQVYLVYLVSLSTETFTRTVFGSLTERITRTIEFRSLVEINCMQVSRSKVPYFRAEKLINREGVQYNISFSGPGLS